MSAPLQFFASQNHECRFGTGNGTYQIVYPFSGSYPGTVPKFNALYSPDSGSGAALGQFDTLADAQAACQAHFDQLPP